MTNSAHLLYGRYLSRWYNDSSKWKGRDIIFLCSESADKQEKQKCKTHVRRRSLFVPYYWVFNIDNHTTEIFALNLENELDYMCGAFFIGSFLCVSFCLLYNAMENYVVWSTFNWKWLVFLNSMAMISFAFGIVLQVKPKHMVHLNSVDSHIQLLNWHNQREIYLNYLFGNSFSYVNSYYWSIWSVWYHGMSVRYEWR